MLRNLSSYYYKEPTMLYLVRGAISCTALAARVAACLPGRLGRALCPVVRECVRPRPVRQPPPAGHAPRPLCPPPQPPAHPPRPAPPRLVLPPAAPPQVRAAQGLVHMGKGLLGVSPYHTERQLLSGVALAGLLAVVFSCEDAKATLVRGRGAGPGVGGGPAPTPIPHCRPASSPTCPAASPPP